MTNSITRETWRAEVKARHLTVAAVAQATGRSHRAVRSYYEGTRNPSDEWIAQVRVLVGVIDAVRP